MSNKTTWAEIRDILYITGTKGSKVYTRKYKY
jgi:hypothetical protein